MAHGFKNDGEARALWGSAYEAIPKSVFAVACWHLSDCASEEGIGQGAAEKRFAEEVEALALNGCITVAQGKAAVKALSKLFAESASA